MAAKMIVLVTPGLAAGLDAARSTLAELDTRKGGLNDQSDYATIVLSLEALVTNTLAAAAASPLIGVQPTGARIDVGFNTTLALTLNQAAAYLRGTASNLLVEGNLSPYHDEATHEAHTLLKQVTHLIMDGVVKEARADLATLSWKSGTDLVKICAEIANLAH